MLYLKSNRSGISVIELLVGIVFLSIVALAIAKSTILAQRMAQKSAHRSVAMQLVTETLEQQGTVNPETLSPSANIVDQVVRKNGVTLKKSVTYAINPDGTRLVTVSVKDPILITGFTITQSNTYSLWGAQ